MIAAVTLFFIITLSALITRIAAIALAHTGLSTQIARFQARSAYTGSGFTSSETEKIMNHPVRRKIIYSLMLIGNAGIVTAMSSLILTFVLPDSNASRLYGLLIVVVGLAILWWAIRSDWVDRGLSKVINRMLKKYTDINVQDYAAVLHLHDNYHVSEMRVEKDSWLANKTLIELDLRKEGITVLGIDRKGEGYLGSPTGNSKILPLDVITVYGKAEVFESIYKRSRDIGGEIQHQKFVEKEADRKQQEEGKN
ncbi:TrkA C-terminal domain-containing protein [Salegentibacter maritimus]|uniref:TrkA C-terminal domain-containing protein n=1 Tax=Salegentibacter maritimus TaxID=2794347 RepID=A0ABS0TI62_9FLAO|nr:TrkA C-terminal domain-containing protein [Salegentibacter maritimus]MBI6116387.1 TrkA C-terminal domain-containing protein [Salegentibacter maritimus]MBI6120757.1 TrkA C-terminal domain-containing protein [Salegentibacter maritimus]